MECAWKALLSVLPGWMVSEVDSLGKGNLQELRLRLGQPPRLLMGSAQRDLARNASLEDLNFCVNAASRYSPWAAATARKGYLTAPGGHRIGLCGEAVMRNGKIDGIKNLTSLNIRIARDYPGIGEGIPSTGSVLILGAPSWGKTTLLRDLIRGRGNRGQQVAVVDERGELFPSGTFSTGKNVDILTGCGKAEGIPMLLRTMGPQCIAVDEITQEEDCCALLDAVGCGAELLATVHATSVYDLRKRAFFRHLLDAAVFDSVVILRQDKSWRLERIGVCT